MTKTRRNIWRRAAMAAFLIAMVALLRVLAAPDLAPLATEQIAALILTAVACVAAAVVALMRR